MSLLIFEKQGWQQPVLQELKGEGRGEEEFRHAREHEKEDIGTPVRTLLFFPNPLLIDHLHDGVILLIRPESFTFFLSYLNLVIPARIK